MPISNLFAVKSLFNILLCYRVKMLLSLYLNENCFPYFIIEVSFIRFIQFYVISISMYLAFLNQLTVSNCSKKNFVNSLFLMKMFVYFICR